MLARFSGLLSVALVAALIAPEAASGMCCTCQNCSGAAFCVDGIQTTDICAGFCASVGCAARTFDGVDSCSGGCDGAPIAPTATPPSTFTATRTPTASATGTVTETPTITATASDTATPAATPTASETPTASVTPALGGAVRYYGSELPVADVTIALSGGTSASTTTDADGRYGFADAGTEMLSIQPSKEGDFDNGISSLDASYVLETVADLRELNADQTLAGDVTGDGTLSTLDASLILQLQAALIDRFPVAEAAICDSDWIFRPTPDPAPNQTLVQPMVANMVCQQGEIVFDPFTPPVANQDFTAILFGDVTGNWTP